MYTHFALELISLGDYTDLIREATGLNPLMRTGLKVASPICRATAFERNNI